LNPCAVNVNCDKSMFVFGALAACRTNRAPGLSFGLHASSDATIVARGRYLVQGPGPE
jgi:hypothetical protein